MDNFRFWDRPITMPEYGEPATNVYDMRLTAHEDGWIYGIFCVERKDPDAAPGDLSSAVAAAGVARTKDLVNWERLPDLKCKSQQRNVVLHPEFVDGKYALYTRPQDGFIDAGSGGGIGWALVDITHAEIKEETIIDLSVKQGMMDGWFGNLMAGGGHDVPGAGSDMNDWRYQGAAMMGRFTDKSQISIILNGNNTNNRGFNDVAGSMMQSMRGAGRGMGRRYHLRRDCLAQGYLEYSPSILRVATFGRSCLCLA